MIYPNGLTLVFSHYGCPHDLPLLWWPRNLWTCLATFCYRFACPLHSCLAILRETLSCLENLRVVKQLKAPLSPRSFIDSAQCPAPHQKRMTIPSPALFTPSASTFWTCEERPIADSTHNLWWLLRARGQSPLRLGWCTLQLDWPHSSSSPPTCSLHQFLLLPHCLTFYLFDLILFSAWFG